MSDTSTPPTTAEIRDEIARARLALIRSAKTHANTDSASALACVQAAAILDEMARK